MLTHNRVNVCGAGDIAYIKVKVLQDDVGLRLVYVQTQSVNPSDQYKLGIPYEDLLTEEVNE